MIGDKFVVQVQQVVPGGLNMAQFTVMALMEKLSVQDIRLFFEEMLDSFITEDDGGAFDCGAPVMLVKRKRD